MRKIYIIAIVAVLIIGAGWGGYEIGKKKEREKNAENTEQRISKFTDEELYGFEAKNFGNMKNWEDILTELETRTLKEKDSKSFDRIITLYQDSDAAIAESLHHDFYKIFLIEPEFFCKNTYKNKNNISVYDAVLDEAQLSDLMILNEFGECSKEFNERIKYFQENSDAF